MRIGNCIRNVEEISGVKAAGFDFYEFSGKEIAAMDETAFSALVRESETVGLPCIGFNSYCGGRPAIVGEDVSLKETEDYARLLCRRGHRLGIRSIGIGAPAARRLPQDYPVEKADRQCRSFLQITAEECRRWGILLLFEAVHEKACSYAVRTADAVRVVEQAGVPDLGIVLDFYHMHVMGESFSDAEGAFPYLRHVHVSTCEENLWRGYPLWPDREEYRRIFARLKRHGYRQGTVSVENTSFDLETAKSSLEMLRELDRETEG